MVDLHGCLQLATGTAHQSAVASPPLYSKNRSRHYAATEVQARTGEREPPALLIHCKSLRIDKSCTITSIDAERLQSFDISLQRVADDRVSIE